MATTTRATSGSRRVFSSASNQLASMRLIAKGRVQCPSLHLYPTGTASCNRRKSNLCGIILSQLSAAFASVAALVLTVCRRKREYVYAPQLELSTAYLNVGSGRYGWQFRSIPRRRRLSPKLPHKQGNRERHEGQEAQAGRFLLRDKIPSVASFLALSWRNSEDPESIGVEEGSPQVLAF
jgi:hypothetical protein